jgi:hypothetical protein
MTKHRARAQITEIDSADNRWFCSQHFGRKVTDFQTLCRYFCDYGGAADFAERWDEAMGRDNRWYCGEHYGRRITDESILWAYYLAKQREACGQTSLHESTAELSFA